jgi:nucleotide-binding universal stress UspA family protein
VDVIGQHLDDVVRALHVIKDRRGTARRSVAGDPAIVVGRSGHAAHHILGSVPVRLQHHSPFPVVTIP